MIKSILLIIVLIAAGIIYFQFMEKDVDSPSNQLKQLNVESIDEINEKLNKLKTDVDDTKELINKVKDRHE